jgi:hypothetical protein
MCVIMFLHLHKYEHVNVCLLIYMCSYTSVKVYPYVCLLKFVNVFTDKYIIRDHVSV